MLGSKVSNLLLGEKNFCDFVDKNLGQERERLIENELELDPVCHHLVGGVLDYPHQISHDFCDITTAFDIYLDGFTKKAAAEAPPKFGSGIFPSVTVKNERLGKMPFRGDELSERQFINATLQSCVKIRAHIIDCTEECTSSGRLENLYVIISNIVVVRNYIWTFQQILNIDSKLSEKLKLEYDEFAELVEVISDRMLQCQMNLLTTYVIHDEASQNWTSVHAYYEGLRGSPTIQVWAYFLKEMQRDMWKIMPPQLSQRILGILLSDSLSILTARYSKIQPCEETKSQFCSDIMNILATVEEILFNISTNLEEFYGEVDPLTSKTVFSIHLKCACLVTSLVLLGAPLDVLYKTFRRGLSSCSLLEKPNHSSQPMRPIWMTIVSTLCPSYHKNMDPMDVQLTTNLRLLCGQPQMNWALTYKVVAMNSSRLGVLILQLFSSVLAPPTDFLLEGKGFKKCLNAGCIDLINCHSLPKSVANHLVSSCIVYVLAHTIPREQLAKVYRSLLSKVVDWSVMDRTQVWTTTKRPVWFQSMIDLLLPILKTCVQGLCVSLINKKCTGEEDPTPFVVELLNYLTEILSIIPRGFFIICDEIDDMVHSSIYPVRNNVHIHFLVTALYQLLNLGSGIISSVNGFVKPVVEPEEATSSAEDVKDVHSLLLSVSERLCHLDNGIFDQAIHRLISQIESMMRHAQVDLQKKQSQGILTEFYLTDDLAGLKANFLLEEPEGQLALRNIYWFLVTHGEVLEDHLTSNSSNYGIFSGGKDLVPIHRDSHPHKAHAHSSKVAPAPAPASQIPNQSNSAPHSLKISPWTRTYFKSPSTIHSFHFVNKYRTFDEIVWEFNEKVDWVSTVRNSKLGLHKTLILRQLERRDEFKLRKNSVVPGSDTLTEREALLVKMVNETRTLLTYQ